VNGGGMTVEESKIKNKTSKSSLVVNEIYLSLQGESTFAGLPCVFVRLTACDLRCSYCDTAYAFTEGKKRTVEAVRAEVNRLAAPFGRGRGENGPLTPSHSPSDGARVKGHRGVASGPGRLPLVELTGGEPLLQKNSLLLMAGLCDDGYTVLLETSGAHDIAPVDRRVRRIVDLKCPGSGEAARNRLENLAHLRATDEIKFVISTREDYEWAARMIAEHKLDAICPLLFSWAHPLAPGQQDKTLNRAPAGQTPISRQELSERIMADALPVRFQVQLHKVIWPPEQRGV
jgi:7-carboxy-7-deazaguanine synthase